MRTLIFVAGIFMVLPSSAQDSATVIPLWQNGAPGFENKKTEPEQAKDWSVKNINNPTLTVFLPPKDSANGAAVIICPGGGFRALGFNSEGKEPAKFFNKLGVAAFVLKYRLFREENSPYTPANSKQDIFRAIRLVKSLATTYHLDTARIGVMGFSAGGEEAAWVAYHFSDKNFASNDEIDRVWARPAFQILIYPGPLAVPDILPATSPPTFMLAANDDTCCSATIVKLLQMHRASNVPVEIHLYQQGNHAFNMGYRSTLTSIKSWPQRLAEWLNDYGWLKKN